MASEKILSLRAKAREWQAEADVAVVQMRPTYQRIADAYAKMADELDEERRRPTAPPVNHRWSSGP